MVCVCVRPIRMHIHTGTVLIKSDVPEHGCALRTRMTSTAQRFCSKLALSLDRAQRFPPRRCSRTRSHWNCKSNMCVLVGCTIEAHILCGKSRPPTSTITPLSPNARARRTDLEYIHLARQLHACVCVFMLARCEWYVHMLVLGRQARGGVCVCV